MTTTIVAEAQTIAKSAWKLRMVYFDGDGYPMLHKEPEPLSDAAIDKLVNDYEQSTMRSVRGLVNHAIQTFINGEML